MEGGDGGEKQETLGLLEINCMRRCRKVCRGKEELGDFKARE